MTSVISRRLELSTQNNSNNHHYTETIKKRCVLQVNSEQNNRSEQGDKNSEKQPTEDIP